MNEFVEQCRREWRRLRVPDAVADEMAADLAADLEEAEAEGASAREVLGSDTSDPRSFAASWAAARAVIPPPRSRAPGRLVILLAVAALTVTVAGAALVIFASSPEPLAVPAPPLWFEFQEDGGRLVTLDRASTSPVLVALPPPERGQGTVWNLADPPIVRFAPAGGSEAETNLFGAILLGIGLAGIIVSMLFLLRSSRLGTTTRVA